MPIPPHAKKVFTGTIFDVHQWEQELYNGDTATFERLTRPDAVKIIAVDPDGALYVVEEEQPSIPTFFDVFGGRKDPGEDDLETAKRELKEESGFESDDWELFSATEPSGKIEWRIVTFIARNVQKVCEPKLDAGEKIKIKKVSIDEFVEILMKDNFRGKSLTFDMLKEHYKDPTLSSWKKRILGS